MSARDEVPDLEHWTFPPVYDDAYFPDPRARFWFPKRETADPEARDAAILARIRAVLRYAYDNAPFYRRKWDPAGVIPEDVRSFADFEQVPVITKADLRAAQAEHPPFGDYLCIDPSEVYHLHGTSGTTGRPTAFAIGRDDWRRIANAHARIMWSMGIRPGDTVMIAAIFSLYMGSWGALAGAERLGCKCLPFGAGASGMTARCAQWMDMVKPAAFYGTPSYALYLAEVAREEGYDPRNFGLRLLFFSGEPGASVPGIRERIEEAYGAYVCDSGTMGEATPWMSAAGSAESPGMILWQDLVYHEVCDPQTYRGVPAGQRGTLTYTTLERSSQPMIRLVSGDVTHWAPGPTPCGRSYPLLPDGIYGRIDDMITVRGENVYPSEVDAVLNTLAGYGGEHRIVISRARDMDRLVVQVEAAESLAEADHDALRTRAEQALGKVLGVRAQVVIEAAGTFPRTDFKARRVVDDRQLFARVAGEA